MIRRLLAGVALLSAALAILAVVAAAVGPVGMPLSHSLAALLDWAGLDAGRATALEARVVQQIRLPRIVLASAVGAALGVAGATMQGIFRNPLADPGIVGVSAGGAVGAVLAIVTGFHSVFSLALPAAAFVGAMGATFLVYGIASAGGRLSVGALLLAGVAVSSFLGAVVSSILYFSTSQDVQREIIFWLAGGFDAALWHDVQVSLPLIAAGIIVAGVFARDLNLLMLGDDDATALGVRAGVTRTVLLIAASLVTGVAVAFSGTIAFVGLIVPHMVRLVVGPDHRVLMPLSALGGAAFLLGADTIARIIVAPAEVRVGIITAFVGAPFFLFLLVKNKTQAGAL